MQDIGKRQVIAAAVAAALLSAPTVLLAQSSVTISGRLTMEFSNVKIKNRAGRNSETALTDNTSYIRFSVTEDLGGGLQAIGQVETRNQLDTGSLNASGANHVGLRSKTLGTLRFGRENLHFFHRESDMFAKGGSLRGDSIGILGYANGGATSIANTTRTANVIQWLSPDWIGFTLGAAYSSNPDQGSASGGLERDVGSAVRKGRAWNLNPNYKGSNFQVGYSYWDGKSDGAFTGLGAPTILTGAIFGIPAGMDQRSHRFYGSYRWGGFKAGLAIDDSELKTVTALATTKISDRVAWSIPLGYTTGPHSFFAEFSKARNDKAAGFAGLDTKANLGSLTYVYSLSKRTAVGLNYARVDNGRNAFYNLFTSRNGTQDPLGVASTGPNPNAGEDPRVIGASISHYF